MKLFLLFLLLILPFALADQDYSISQYSLASGSISASTQISIGEPVVARFDSNQFGFLFKEEEAPAIAHSGFFFIEEVAPPAINIVFVGAVFLVASFLTGFFIWKRKKKKES